MGPTFSYFSLLLYKSSYIPTSRGLDFQDKIILFYFDKKLCLKMYVLGSIHSL